MGAMRMMKMRDWVVEKCCEPEGLSAVFAGVRFLGVLRTE